MKKTKTINPLLTIRKKRIHYKKIIMLLLLSTIAKITVSQSFTYDKICAGAPALTSGTSGSSCGITSTDYINKYGKQSFYIPKPTDPVLTVKLTFHVIANSAGTLSPWPGTAGLNALNLCANYLHNWTERYSAQRQTNYDNVPLSCNNAYIYDQRINYEVTNVYFYYNDVANTSNNGGTIANLIDSVHPGVLNEGVPIVFNNGNIGGAAGQRMDFNGHTGVQTLINYGGNDAWYLQAHLRHELGHVFGLYHTYQFGGAEDQFGFYCSHPDFLCDVFPLNNPTCASTPCGGYGCGVCPEDATNAAPIGCNTLKSNNVMSGQPGNEWYSPLQMGRIRRNLHLAHINNTRDYVKEMTSDAATPWLITSNETWDFDIHLYQDIVVKTGATLTIKCKLGMSNGGRIVVERGAKLIIDGGEVYPIWTNWLGIQVWGTSLQNQTIASNGLSPDQGIVRIINQGTIREAQEGIATGKYNASGDFDYTGFTGGIIQCNNAKFINCWRAIQFMLYHNFASSNTRINNISYVYNSLFETNAVRRDNQDPNVFVSLWEVDGVKFYGNTYQNTRIPLPAIDKRGRGFYSNDANYLIDRYKVCNVGCTSYTTNNPSKFTNLQYGVYVQNFTPLANIKINDNDFVGCNRAVYFGGTYNVTVTNNRINVGEGTTAQAFLPYGIYGEGSSAYNVSNNTITTSQTTNYNLSLATGICINGTNGPANKIYRNTINMMGAGASVIGDNKGANAGDGLRLLCNQFGQGVNGKNQNDIYLSEQPIMPPTWLNGKIDIMQGNLSIGANNYFSHTNSSVPYVKTDFHDKGSAGGASSNGVNAFQYFYNPLPTQETQPFYFAPSLFVNTPNSSLYDASGMCPVSLTPGASGSTSGPKLYNSVAYALFVGKINSGLINTELVKVDGGNTQSLLTTVNNGNLTADNLKSLLLEKSPYLTDQVLIAYFAKTTTVPANIIALHNANKPISQAVWQTILNRRLGQADMATLNKQQSVNQVNELIKLYAKVGSLNQDKGYVFDRTLEGLMSDTLTGWNKDSIVALLKGDNRPDAKRRLVSAYIYFNDYTQAASQIASITTDLGGTLDDFCKVQQSLIQLKQQSNNIYSLKTNQQTKSAMEQIVANINGSGYIYGEGLLGKVFNTKYFEYISLPNASGTSSRLGRNETEIVENTNHVFKLFPNPSNGNVNVQFFVQEAITSAQILVYDFTGKLVITNTVNPNDTLHILNTNGLSTGMYLVTLVVDGKVKDQQKLIKE